MISGAHDGSAVCGTLRPSTPATASAAVCSSIREQGGTSRGAGRSMNCTSGLAVVSHRGGGASPDACGPDIPAFDRPRSTSGAAYPSGSRVPARHRSRMGLAAWSRCMTARSTSGDSPNHGPTLALFDRAVRNWGRVPSGMSSAHLGRFDTWGEVAWWGDIRSSDAFTSLLTFICG